MSYVQASIHKRKREVVYDAFVTDTLKNTNDILANIYTGSVMKKRYVEVIRDLKKGIEEDTRTAEEIINDIGNKLDEIGAT